MQRVVKNGSPSTRRSGRISGLWTQLFVFSLTWFFSIRATCAKSCMRRLIGNTYSCVTKLPTTRNLRIALLFPRTRFHVWSSSQPVFSTRQPNLLPTVRSFPSTLPHSSEISSLSFRLRKPISSPMEKVISRWESRQSRWARFATLENGCCAGVATWRVSCEAATSILFPIHE